MADVHEVGKVTPRAVCRGHDHTIVKGDRDVICNLGRGPAVSHEKDLWTEEADFCSWHVVTRECECVLCPC
jgi:hypothetical protein